MGCSIFVWLEKNIQFIVNPKCIHNFAAIAGILYGFYHAWPWWKPYSPYLISGNLFLLVAAAAVINIFPSARIGRALHTGRLWFHHYVYGFFVLVIIGNLRNSVYISFFSHAFLDKHFKHSSKRWKIFCLNWVNLVLR